MNAEDAQYPIASHGSNSDCYAALAAFIINPSEIDVVLIDYFMPGCNTKDIINNMKKLRKDIPIVVISGYDKSKCQMHINSKENIYYIGKPFTKITISQLLSVCCEN